MVILILVNFLSSLAYDIANAIFVNSIPTFDTLTTWFTNVSLPTTFYNILANATYFLPMGTIVILWNFTVVFIFFKIVLAFIHFITFGKVA